VLSARLSASVPGIKIHQLRAVPGNATPARDPTAKNDTGIAVELYAAGGGGALLILIGAVVLAVVLRQRSTQTTETNDYDDDDDDPSNYEEEDDMGQTMESTDYRPQNGRNLVLPSHCGDARGAYLYNGHAYNNAFNYLTYKL